MIGIATSLALAFVQSQTDPVVIIERRNSGARNQTLSVSGDCKGSPVSVEVSVDSGRVMVRFGEASRDVTADIPALDIQRRDRSLAKTFPICHFDGEGMEVLFLLADVEEDEIRWTWRSFDVDRNLRVSNVEGDSPVPARQLARAFD